MNSVSGRLEYTELLNLEQQQAALGGAVAGTVLGPGSVSRFGRVCEVQANGLTLGSSLTGW